MSAKKKGTDFSWLPFEILVVAFAVLVMIVIGISGQYLPDWALAIWMQTKEILAVAWWFFAKTWWFWYFAFGLYITELMWLFWRQEVFKHHDLTWKMFEIIIPREILKGPRGMEQVLQTIRETRNAPANFEEWYIDGEVTRWQSLEVTSFGGEIHMYVRCYKKQAHLIEAAFLSYYPDVELIEVEDYAQKLPHTASDMIANGYEMYGSELLLARSPMYPLRTYRDFESPDEETLFDPMSTLLEVLSKVRKNELVGIQFVIVPAPPSWNHHFEHEVEELRNKKEPGEFFAIKTARQSDILKAVEENISKPAFETIIRFIYLAPKELYYDAYGRRGIMSTFNQYASLDLNYFTQNFSAATPTKVWNFPYIFHNTRSFLRKQRMLNDYIHRATAPESWLERVMQSHPMNWNHTQAYPLNVEVLATMFHPPQRYVLTAPHIRRSESKKAGPSAGLPIYGEEAALEKFQ